MTPRTDLAAEARALFLKNTGQTTRLSGVAAHRRQSRGIALECVEILDERGAQALKKPCGHYETLEFDPKRSDFARLSALLAKRLEKMLPKGSALIVGLGNRAVTPDALGPMTAQRIFLTRHLRAQLPEHFGTCREVSAICPGVLATTGMESAELVRGAVAHAKPDFVLAIDALCAAEARRLCRTVQLSDTGIVPGSGVGNHRAALNHETLGVPVCALGAPTVADASAFGAVGGQILTPRDIDAQVRFLSRLLADALNRVLHPQFSAREAARFFPNV